MKKYFIIIICSLFFGGTSFAQTIQPDSTKVMDSTEVLKTAQTQTPQQSNPYVKKEKKQGANKWYFGGNFTFTFGSYTSIGIWPLAAYKIVPKLSIGIQPGYEYLKYDSYGGEYETSNYGIRVFSRYRVIPQAYIHAEYASINYGYQTPVVGGGYEDSREWVPFVFLGAGFSQRIGGNAYAYVQVLFDVLNSDKSPYGSGEPFWTVGVAAGF